MKHISLNPTSLIVAYEMDFDTKKHVLVINAFVKDGPKEAQNRVVKLKLTAREAFTFCQRITNMLEKLSELEDVN